MRKILLVVFVLAFFQASWGQNTALSFDGTDDYVSTSTYVVPTSGDFTVEFWVYSTTITGYREFVSQGSSGSAFYIGTTAGTGEIRCGDNWGSTGVTMPLNQWVHVALVKSGSSATLYLNGIQKANLASGYGISAAGTSFRMGLQYQGGENLNGRLDEVRIWNTACSASQIKANMYKTVESNSTGLVAYYKMNEGSGTALGNSTTVVGIDGTLTNGPAWINSPVQAAANALALDGNDYLQVPYSSTLDMTNTLTMEAWVYPSNGNWMNVVMKGDYGYGLSLSGSAGLNGCNTGNRLIYWDQNNCGSTIRSALSYTQNAWHHVAVTVQDIGTQLEIYFYLDGVQDGPYYSSLSSISNGGVSSDLFIGRQGSSCACNYVTGTVDEVRIWNTVRTASEIQSNKDVSLSGSEAGLAALYSFNQGSASGDNNGLVTAVDGTVNNNHATLIGFALTGSSSNWVEHASLFVLPLRMTEIKVSKMDQSVLLQWATSGEENSREFIIERSADGNSFIPIGAVPAAGKSSTIRTYSYQDRQPLEKMNYYRLRLIDLDAKTGYSKVVGIKMEPQDKGLLAFPNPAEQVLQLQTSLKGVLHIAIYDIKGWVVQEMNVRGEGSSTGLSIDVTSLSKGIYHLRVQSEKGAESISFIKR